MARGKGVIHKGRTHNAPDLPVLSVGEQQPLLSARSSALRTVRHNVAPNPFIIPCALPLILLLGVEPGSFFGWTVHGGDLITDLLYSNLSLGQCTSLSGLVD